MEMEPEKKNKNMGAFGGPKKAGPSIPPTKVVRLPNTVKLDDDLVGKKVWYFHPRDGVSHVKVTGLYKTTGRYGDTQWGLWYDYVTERGRVLSRMIWVKDYPIFDSRTKCERWVEAMLKKSAIDREMEEIFAKATGDSM